MAGFILSIKIKKRYQKNPTWRTIIIRTRAAGAMKNGAKKNSIFDF